MYLSQRLFIAFVMDKKDYNFYVHLVNNSPMNFQAVKVFTGGFSSNEDGLLETSKVVREEGPMTACSTLQIDQSHWDELDFLIWYHLDLLDEEGMVITLDERDGESIDEEIKTTNMESQYRDFSKK